MITSVAILAASMLGLYVFGTTVSAAAILQAVESFGLGGVAVSMQARVLVVAPRSTDIASAGFSSAFPVRKRTASPIEY